MPYESKAQVRFMHWKHPKIAARWDKEYDTPSNLPERKGSKVIKRMLSKSKER